MQSAQERVICEQKNQSFLVESSDKISLPTSDQLSSVSFITNDSDSVISLLTTDSPFPSSHSPTNEENVTEKFQNPFKINVEDCPHEHITLKADLENVVPKLDDKILHLINV